MSNYFTAAELTAPIKRRFHEFDVSLNGVTKRVRIRSLTERERSEYELSGTDASGKWKRDRAVAMKVSLIALCVVDGEGNQVLSTSDATKLLEQDGSVTGLIYDECVRHTGVDALSVDATAKNSGGGEGQETSED